MLLCASLPIFKRFTITCENTQKIAYIRDLNNAGEFYISFIHSVNRTPVEEYYKISGDKFIVYKTVFESYGAGMPDVEAGSKVEFENGKITVSNLDIELDSFSVFIGTVASHEIVFEDKSIPLASLSPPQSLLKFAIRRVSVIQLISNINN